MLKIGIPGFNTIYEGSSFTPVAGPGIDIWSNEIAVGLNSIMVAHSIGITAAEFPKTANGLTAALASAISGDVVILPPGTISGGPWTIPNGVVLTGLGKLSSTNVSVVIGPASGQAEIYGIELIANATSNADSSIIETGYGSLLVRNSILRSNSVNGTPFVVKSVNSGKTYLMFDHVLCMKDGILQPGAIKGLIGTIDTIRSVSWDWTSSLDGWVATDGSDSSEPQYRDGAYEVTNGPFSLATMSWSNGDLVITASAWETGAWSFDPIATPMVIQADTAIVLSYDATFGYGGANPGLHNIVIDTMSPASVPSRTILAFEQLPTFNMTPLLGHSIVKIWFILTAQINSTGDEVRLHSFDLNNITVTQSSENYDSVYVYFCTNMQGVGIPLNVDVPLFVDSESVRFIQENHTLKAELVESGVVAGDYVLPALSIDSGGRITAAASGNASGLNSYNSNAAALADGLLPGDFYTETGTNPKRLCVVYEQDLTNPGFYVSSSGNDSNPGTEGLPWKTISKVNSAGLVAGDNIYFKRGDTFAGRLQPTKNGSTGKLITYGAYGSGARPIINGSASDGSLRIDEGIRYHRYENIDFNGSNHSYYAVVNVQSDNHYFFSCLFRNAQIKEGFNCYEGTDGGIIHHITLDTCEAYDNYASGFASGSVTGAAGPHDILYTKCLAHNNGHVLGEHGIYARHGAIIDQCVCYSNFDAGIKVNCEGVFDSPYTPTVRRNICYDNKVGIDCNNRNSLIYNNVCYSNKVANFYATSDGIGSLVYFNTFVNGLTVNFVAALRLETHVVGITFKNNLFIQDTDVYNGRVVKGITSPSTALLVGTENTFDYNVYYHGPGNDYFMFYDANDTGHVFSEWQGYGADPHGSNPLTLPGFTTRYTNFHPVKGGNLAAKGVTISGYITDIEGVTRPNPPTPGAYEAI